LCDANADADSNAYSGMVSTVGEEAVCGQGMCD